MFHKIKSVRPISNCRLLVSFTEGTTKEYDVSLLFHKIKAFQSLTKVQGLFESVVVDPGGYGISWDDELDLSSEEIWVNGKSVSTPFDNLLSFADATDLWGLSESTLRKAVEYKKLIPGVDVQKYGKQWIILKDALYREYGKPKS